MRQRMLAVVQGRAVDRVPFVHYENLGAPTRELWSVLGRQNVGVLRWSAAHRIEAPNCRFESREIMHQGLRGTLTTLHTPAGVLTEEKLFQPDLGAAATRKHFVIEPADYRPLIAYLRDVVVHEDLGCLERDLRELGEDGLPHVTVDRTPFQQLWVQWVSIEDLCLHLVDCPDLVEECVALMAAILRKEFHVAREAAAPYVVFPDNITAPVIGEERFRRYCVPLYNELAEMLSDKEAPVFVHMDGDLKPLWKAIGESGVGGIDSLSPPPDNDTSVAQALAMWPEMRVFVNFPSSVHLAPPSQVYEQAARLLREGGASGRLQIQVSEDVPPGVWRTSFPQIVKAISDSGAPAA